jgi:adenylate kinase
MNALILFGPPGSGKGTQAARLIQRHGWTHLATGDLFREALAKGDPLALEAQGLMRAGRLVPDALVGGMVRKRLDQLQADGASSGVIFDGFPRNVSQVGMLDAILAERSIPLLGLVALDVDDDLLVKRLAGRRSCPRCGRGYNTYFNAPKEAERCDVDGAALTRRPDDVEETIRERLRVYREQTQPVMDVYRKRGALEVLNGGESAEAVWARLAGVAEAWTGQRG